MTRTTGRTARKYHRCSRCERPIRPAEGYLEHVCSPDHDGLGNTGWWRIAECSECAVAYGRYDLLPLGAL